MQGKYFWNFVPSHFRHWLIDFVGTAGEPACLCAHAHLSGLAHRGVSDTKRHTNCPSKNSNKTGTSLLFNMCVEYVFIISSK